MERLYHLLLQCLPSTTEDGLIRPYSCKPARRGQFIQINHVARELFNRFPNWYPGKSSRRLPYLFIYYSFIHSFTLYLMTGTGYKKKGKAIPVTDREGP
jgi:hypothetical protein